MPTINQLSSTSSLASGDQIPVYDASDGDARKASLSTLLSFIEANFANPDLETQTFAPTGSGFTVTATASTSSIWMIVNPTGAFAAGTVQFPPDEDCFDGQVIVATTSQAITSLTVDGNGATVGGAPTTLGTNGFAQFRYQASATKWWCVAQSLGSIDSFTDITITGEILSGDGETMLAFAQVGAGTAVDYITLRYAAAGQAVSLAAEGASTDIEMRVLSKGAGNLRLDADGGAAIISGVNVAITANTTDVSIASTSGDVVLIAGGVIDVQDRMEFATAPVLPVSTVAGLPATPIQGMKAMVTDANSTTFNADAVGGSTNVVPVFYNGTVWKVG